MEVRMYNYLSADLQQLLLYLRIIASDGPPNTEHGLCENVRLIHIGHCHSAPMARFSEILEECFVTWKFYSGVITYPVPYGVMVMSARNAYMHEPKWPARDGSSKPRAYCLRRMHLVWHCIDSIKAELKRRADNAEVLWN